MTKKYVVHQGYYEEPNGRRPVAWVETYARLQPDAWDLLNGLGSKYLRDTCCDDAFEPPADLPATLPQQEIVRIYREERDYHGRNGVGLWAETASEGWYEAAENRLKELVIDAFPEMEEYLS